MACRVERVERFQSDTYRGVDIPHKNMMAEFKRKLKDANIMNELRKREFYESEGVARRRKKREAENKKFRDQMRAESEKGKPKEKDFKRED